MTKYTDQELQAIFTKNLNKYIALSGQKQVDIANAISVPTTTFNTWVTGDAIPRMGNIQKLADYFGVNKSDLLEDKSDQEISDAEVWAIRQRLLDNPGMRMLFSATENVSSKDLMAVAEMIKKFKGED